MKEKEKDLMERYIYEIIRRVSVAQKEDIRMELQELIEDMYEADGGDMNAVLNKLGDPADFARKYRDENNYVISPGYYDNYIWVLKIVLICVVASSVLSWVVSAIVNGTVEFTLVGALIYAFGFVTLVFVVLERLKIKVDIREKKAWRVKDLEPDGNTGKFIWTPSQMPPVPSKKSQISRAETIVGIVFIVIFGMLLVFVPQLFGAYIIEDSKVVGTIPIFNLSEWSSVFPVIAVGLLISFLDEIVRLITGCYCRLVLVSNIIAGTIQIVLSIIALKVLPIWNANFTNEVSEQFSVNITSKQDILFYWGTDVVSNIVLAIICAVTVLELSTTIYKTIRYGI